MRIPITLRQLPRLALDLWRRRQVLKKPLSRPARFRLCFFSCESYFKYLVCSIHSLQRAASAVEFDIWVFNDIDMPITAGQLAALERLVPGVRVLPWPKSMGWGAEQISNIWRAYSLAAEGLFDDDFVVRVDSDVFFFNDRVFQAVQRSDADMVGDGHFVDFAYCQGGCYFLRVSAVREVIARLRVVSIAELAPQFGTVVEDIAATFLVRWVRRNVWMTWFMMFPDELRRAGGLSASARHKFSCVHFVMKNKAAMLEAYERDVLSSVELPAFRALLTTE